ncbi:MAG: hypothetical protein M9928_05030 [Anaerolineae bacterium]|nr:hypothetical protein [Anaerolineae bacterium]
MTTKIPGTFDGKVKVDHSRARMIGGATLIIVGAFALFSLFADVHLIPLLIAPIAGLILLLWGVGSRNNGLLVAGSVLLGIGIGLALTETVLHSSSASTQTGVLLVCFAFGWLLVTVLSFLFGRKRLWWPLLPGAICFVAGIAMLFNTNALVGEIGRFWPVLLVIAGIIIIILRRR